MKNKNKNFFDFAQSFPPTHPRGKFFYSRNQKSFNLFPKNEKGNLLPEETLKIIIAVIGIIFLVFLLTSVYFALTGAQDSKKAEASKDIIVNEIQRLNSGGNYSSDGIFIPNPSGWNLISYTSQKKPNSCAGQNCFCICKNILIDIFDRQLTECDKNGVCAEVPSMNDFGKIKIENDGTWILIQKINDEIQITKK